MEETNPIVESIPVIETEGPLESVGEVGPEVTPEQSAEVGVE